MSPAAIQPITHALNSPADTFAGSGAFSLEDEKKEDLSYASALEADEISIETLHVYDDEQLRE